MSVDVEVYKPRHAVRVVTATSLFDGHDASINIFRRILQSTGVEVIHLGHNRAVQEIVDAAVQEDAQGIAISSYQGGHVEFFKYMVDLLKQGGGGHIKVFGGGGGVIVPEEIEELEAYGVTRIYSPEDGARMGLQGIINHMVETMDFPQGARDITRCGGIDPNKCCPGGQSDHHGGAVPGQLGSAFDSAPGGPSAPFGRKKSARDRHHRNGRIG
jgi:methylmalonyl-CoA mutase cobalamin-binding domain/chain